MGWVDINTNWEDNIIKCETIILQSLGESNIKVEKYLIKPRESLIYERKMNKTRTITMKNKSRES